MSRTETTEEMVGPDQKSCKRVAVIGAGMSGLTAIKSCLEEELEPTCFEQHDQIGGTWYYSPTPRPNQGAPAFDNLITNTCKETTCFSDFPFPDEYPQYMPRKLYAQYFHDYARHFDLYKYIHYRHSVTRVRPAKDHNQSGQWEVHVTNDVTSESKELLFDAVMVCSGSVKDPFIPNIEGLDSFQGKVLHMADYRNPSIFEGKRVLIVGNQNSAGDVAADAGHTGKQTYMSVGEGAWLASRLTTGAQPRELLSRRFLVGITSSSLFSKAIRQACESTIDHRRYGLGSRYPPYLGGAVMLNDELTYLIVSGRVIVKPHLVEMSARSCKFSDGTEVKDIDVVVFATGYRSDYRYIDCPDVQGSVHLKYDLYKWTFPVNGLHPTLAYIGMPSLVGPRSSSAELQSRWATRVFSGRLGLPAKSKMAAHQEKTRKHAIDECNGKYQVWAVLYQLDVADELGVRPNFWKLLLRSPRLAWVVFFGPAFPVHYRLQGPGSWDRAAEESHRAYYRAFNTPCLQRKDLDNHSSNALPIIFLGLLFLALLAVICSLLF